MRRSILFLLCACMGLVMANHVLVQGIGPAPDRTTENSSAVPFTKGTRSAGQPAMHLIRMATDRDRPYIYAIDPGTYDSGRSSLVFINSNTRSVERVLPIAANPVDLTVHEADYRLYVAHSDVNVTTIVDLDSQVVLPSMDLGTGILRINAGRPRRIYTEEGNGTRLYVLNSTTGQRLRFRVIHPGDGEIDPTGLIYYHCDINFGACRILKFDISQDQIIDAGSSAYYESGAPVLHLCEDGSRLFWQGRVFDTSLQEIRALGVGVSATTRHAELAFGYDQYDLDVRVFNVNTGQLITTLPYATGVMAVTQDQEWLVLYDPAVSDLVSIRLSDIAPQPAPPQPLEPAAGASISLPLPRFLWASDPVALGYQVYFGQDSAAVAVADTLAPEFLGSTLDTSFAVPPVLALGESYFWRVDKKGYYSHRTGEPWRFSVAPVIAAPRDIDDATVTGRLPEIISLVLTDGGQPQPWELSESAAWLDLDKSTGTTPDTVTLTIDFDGLTPGWISDSIMLTTSEHAVRIPVRFELLPMAITQMVADLEQPYVYAVQPGAPGKNNALLLFISTDQDRVVKTLRVGTNPTDMDIHYPERRLYVTDWPSGTTKVVDLVTQSLLPALDLGPDTYRISAGRAGRVYVETKDQYIPVQAVDTDSGSVWPLANAPAGNGDADIDPTATYYYYAGTHMDDPVIKYRITDQEFVRERISRSFGYIWDSKLIMSPDGSRIFSHGHAMDADLTDLGNLRREVHATTLHGELAFCYNAGDAGAFVFDTETGDSVGWVNTLYPILAVSGNQSELFVFNTFTKSLSTYPMSDFGYTSGRSLNPVPANGATVLLPLVQLTWDPDPLALSYEVYFGTDSVNVATADSQSAEFLTTTAQPKAQLPPTLDLGARYFWRLDRVEADGIVPGPTWSFQTAPLAVAPHAVELYAVEQNPVLRSPLYLLAPGPSAPWTLRASAPWIAFSSSSGSTPDTVWLDVDASSLLPGAYEEWVEVGSGSLTSRIPVRLKILDLVVSKMVAHRELPYLYALHPGSGNFRDAYLICLRTDVEQVEKVIPIGANPTDLSISYAENRLYVSNRLHKETRVVDLLTLSELPWIDLGPYTQFINAGRAGRVYSADNTFIRAFESSTGEFLSSVWPYSVGDGEVDPTGTYYYHGMFGISNSSIVKFDVSQDSFVIVANSPAYFLGGTRLVMSADGTRLFWKGYAFNSDLQQLKFLNKEVITVTSDGLIAACANLDYETQTTIFNIETGDVLNTLPYATEAMAIASDDEKLFVFNRNSGRIERAWLTCAVDLAGDVNVDGVVGQSDVVYYANYLFGRGPSLQPDARSGDANCDGRSQLLDLVYLVNFLYRAGPEPCDICEPR